MVHYERSYAAGRSVSSFVEFLGWLVVIFGVVVAIAGLAGGGIFGVASRGFGSGEAPFLFHLLAMIPGLGIALGGFIVVAMSQHFKATMDTAEMTRELLLIERNREGIDSKEKVLEATGYSESRSEKDRAPGKKTPSIQEGPRKMQKEVGRRF
ncbi:MAG: hypothetical protein ACQEUZ_01845 [Pseudomonadota bacterium]